MRIHKESKAASPKVSLILLDWSVRESFHICHYLRNQTVPRDQFEVIVLEYYSTLSPALLQFEADFDTIAALEMPKSSYYHKHLMYNIGFLLSKGDIIVICDSDAMAKPTFIESIIKKFEKDPNIILHIDQFRNSRKDMYPFNYPSFEDVIGEGCINWADGITTGIAATSDVLHRRNYGACFCCKRTDYIAIGGADEHVDYVGHICGPYDLTFRLSNLGRKEIWHRKEFLYHTWHPGSDGVNNYLGPHDGRNMSTTALDHIATGRTRPHVTNPLIKKIQKGALIAYNDVCEKGISSANMLITDWDFLSCKDKVENQAKRTYQASSNIDHFCYDFDGNPKCTGTSSSLTNEPIPKPRGLNRRIAKIFSQYSFNALLLLQSIKTTIKSPLTTSLQKKPNKYIPNIVYIIFKAILLLMRHPKFFVSKWYQALAQYHYLNGLVQKLPDDFLVFREALLAKKKLIIFAGNDLQIEYLRNLVAAIKISITTDTDNANSSFLNIEPLSSYAKKVKECDASELYFTKSAFDQLHSKSAISHPY